MKIVMFGHKRIPSREGGIEVVVEKLCCGMVERGHSVTCYNRRGHHVSGHEFDCTIKQKYRGVSLKWVPTLNIKGMAAVTSSFFAALCSMFSGADVVHIHAEGPAFWAWLPKLWGKKVIVTVHGLDWAREKWKKGLASRYIRWGEKIAVRFADQIIVLNSRTEEYFQAVYGRKTTRIPNGVEPVQMAEAQEIVHRFGLEKDSYILFLGRLVPEKGVHFLLEAFLNVHTDKKLVIAGGASDSDDYVKKLKQLAKGDKRIIFTGFVQGRTLQELYSNCYLYVLPSDLEGMALTLLEAMSYGNCCVVSDIPECSEVVGENAVLVPKGDCQALRNCLHDLCGQPEVVAKYRTLARNHISQLENWDTVIEKTLKQYC